MTVTISPIGHSLMKSSRPSSRRVTRTVSSVRSISRATVASTSLPCSGRATTSPIWSRWTGNSMATRLIVVLGGRCYRADILPDAVSVWDVGAKEQLYVTPHESCRKTLGPGRWEALSRAARRPAPDNLAAPWPLRVLDREFLRRRGWSVWESRKTLAERGSLLASAR
jgi:hypothetical protein